MSRLNNFLTNLNQTERQVGLISITKYKCTTCGVVNQHLIELCPQTNVQSAGKNHLTNNCEVSYCHICRSWAHSSDTCQAHDEETLAKVNLWKVRDEPPVYQMQQ